MPYPSYEYGRVVQITNDNLAIIEIIKDCPNFGLRKWLMSLSQWSIDNSVIAYKLMYVEYWGITQ